MSFHLNSKRGKVGEIELDKKRTRFLLYFASNYVLGNREEAREPGPCQDSMLLLLLLIIIIIMMMMMTIMTRFCAVYLASGAKGKADSNSTFTTSVQCSAALAAFLVSFSSWIQNPSRDPAPANNLVVEYFIWIRIQLRRFYVVPFPQHNSFNFNTRLLSFFFPSPAEEETAWDSITIILKCLSCFRFMRVGMQMSSFLLHDYYNITEPSMRNQSCQISYVILQCRLGNSVSIWMFLYYIIHMRAKFSFGVQIRITRTRGERVEPEWE